MVSASTVLTALITLAVFGYMLSLALDITDAYEMLLHTGWLFIILSKLIISINFWINEMAN